MLVYYSEPDGEIILHNYKIYGRHRGQQPTDIPYEMYKEYCVNKSNSLLVEATYRERYFEQKTGKKINDMIAFTFSEIRKLPFPRLKKIAKMIGCSISMDRRSDRKTKDQIQEYIIKLSPKIDLPVNCSYCNKSFYRHFSSTIYCSKGCRKRAETRTCS